MRKSFLLGFSVFSCLQDSDKNVIKNNRIATIQTLSGTGALRTGFDFIKEFYATNVLIPAPTWPNHERIIRHAGLPIKFYQYYDHANKKVDLKNLVHSL